MGSEGTNRTPKTEQIGRVRCAPIHDELYLHLAFGNIRANVETH